MLSVNAPVSEKPFPLSILSLPEKFNQLRILLIEDNPTDRFLVTETLRSALAEQFIPIAEERLEPALLRLQSEHFDAILLDLNLPDSHGLNTLTQLQTASGDLPILILTGDPDENKALQAVRLGAQDFICKSQLTNVLLGRMVRFAVERSHLQHTVTEHARALEKSIEQLQLKNQEIKQYAAIVARDLQQKEALLREVYHRVKNNLQVVQSLLNIGLRQLGQNSPSAVFERVIERVHVMAMVHERLYGAPNLSSLQLPMFLRDLAAAAVESNERFRGDIQVNVDADEITLTLEQAIPFGMLVHELISNCLKHGMDGMRSGTIDITARRCEGGVHFSIHDNGKGIPEDFDLSKHASMGGLLAKSFARQLGGQLKYTNSDGCLIETTFMRI